MRSDYLYKILIIDDDVCDRERERVRVSCLYCLSVWPLLASCWASSAVTLMLSSSGRETCRTTTSWTKPATTLALGSKQGDSQQSEIVTYS